MSDQPSTHALLPQQPVLRRLDRAIRTGVVSDYQLVPNTVPQLVVVHTTGGDEWVGRLGAQAHSYITGLQHGAWAARKGVTR